LSVLDKMRSHSINTIVADPPYFLSNGGFSNRGGKRISVNKGIWDQTSDPKQFYKRFLESVDRLLTDDGTLWVFGLMPNIY
jgi:site-specific DNA-methyltransferase (adenine-specific)